MSKCCLQSINRACCSKVADCKADAILAVDESKRLCSDKIVMGSNHDYTLVINAVSYTIRSFQCSNTQTW